MVKFQNSQGKVIHLDDNLGISIMHVFQLSVRE